MSKIARGVSHSLHQEHGFSRRGVLLLQSLGFTYLAVSVSASRSDFVLRAGPVGVGQIGTV